MSVQNHIRVLPDHVANKIAAGEVVDRPASVLKELVENALDAGATQIDVEVIGGGKQAIIVSDNGSGMSRDDAILSIERHATSKIKDVDDIEHVATLGFRGEALAAISSVSRFTLTTRRADSAAGTELVMAGGKVLEVRDAGCPAGTSIAVRNLFHNVPARKKFLRADQTELSHLRQVFLVYALAHPEVGMRLTVDDREAYRLGPAAKLDERLRELFGPDILDSLREVSCEHAAMKFMGYAGLPQASRADRTEQYIFINGRPASAPVIGFALNESYNTLIPKGRYPVVFLFIRIDPGLVDVNVHPTKRDVRFRDSGMVRDGVIQAVREAIALAPAGDGSAAPRVKELFVASRAGPSLKIPDMPSLPAFAYPRVATTAADAEPFRIGRRDAPGTVVATEAVEAETASGKAPWSWCRILGQAGGLYVVLETGDGVIIMDPHAAHERILYERFMKEVTGSKVKSQGLLSPETVDLMPEDALCVRGSLDLLKTMGFGISDFGGDSFIVDAMPACLGNAAPSAVFVDIARSLDKGGSRGGTERWAEERVAMAACKAAVKANDKLSVQEIEQLVLDLASAEMPYTCPHGRPTIIFMSFAELERKFGRVQ
ncbi:MAG: DNA mismatch repair endonuclease MutL [bacterium]